MKVSYIDSLQTVVRVHSFRANNGPSGTGPECLQDLILVITVHADALLDHQKYLLWDLE